jgi:hypothetical protein
MLSARSLTPPTQTPHDLQDNAVPASSKQKLLLQRALKQ